MKQFRFIIVIFILTLTAVSCIPVNFTTQSPVESVTKDFHLDLQNPPASLEGQLEIHTPYALSSHTFGMSFFLTLKENTYEMSEELTSNGFIDNNIVGGEGMILHIDENMSIMLTGSMPLADPHILTVRLHLSGDQDGYATNVPAKLPESITTPAPFHIEIDQTFNFEFEYGGDTTCLWYEGSITCNPDPDDDIWEFARWKFIFQPKQDVN